MSWAKVSKMNSDFTTSLDILLLINQIDMGGSAVFNGADESAMIKLIRSNALYAHDICVDVVRPILCKRIFETNLNVGSFIKRSFGMEDESVISCQTWNDVLNNEIAIAELSTKKSFWELMDYNVYATEIFGNSAAIIQESRQGLFNAILNIAKKATCDSLIDALRTNAYDFMLSNAEVFLTQESHSYVADTDQLVLYVAIGAGGNGTFVKEGTGAGGDAGIYEQKVKLMKANDVLDATIASDSTISTYLGINFGRGGGDAYNATRVQSGKIIGIAGNGGNGSKRTGGTGCGGAGGYGGGAGGAGGATKYGTSTYGGGAGGVAATVGTLPLVEGTGGTNGTSSSYTAGTAAGAGGGGGGAASNYCVGGGGGGGGYGGGGGGASNYAESYDTNSYGRGGSGGMIIFK